MSITWLAFPLSRTGSSKQDQSVWRLGRENMFTKSTNPNRKKNLLLIILVILRTSENTNKYCMHCSVSNRASVIFVCCLLQKHLFGFWVLLLSGKTQEEAKERSVFSKAEPEECVRDDEQKLEDFWRGSRQEIASARKINNSEKQGRNLKREVAK